MGISRNAVLGNARSGAFFCVEWKHGGESREWNPTVNYCFQLPIR